MSAARSVAAHVARTKQIVCEVIAGGHDGRTDRTCTPDRAGSNVTQPAKPTRYSGSYRVTDRLRLKAGDLGLDIVRLLLRTYEPLLVEVINELKDIFYTNQQRTDALLKRVQRSLEVHQGSAGERIARQQAAEREGKIREGKSSIDSALGPGFCTPTRISSILRIA